MQCPICKTKRYTTVSLDDNLNAICCDTCGGHWISHKNYTSWLESHGEVLPEKAFADEEFDVNDIQEAKICPDCHRILLKYKVGHGLDFFVDHCSSCGGIWLDKNEWNALQARNLHDEIHKIFSTTWQSKIREDKVASKLDQVYTTRFGAESYQKAKDIRQWLQQHPEKLPLLAFISDENPYKM